MDASDSDTRRLAAEALAAGEPTAWFERLYAAAAAGTAVVPWDRGAPNPLLVDWLAGTGADDGAAGRRACVVGCGLGRDAELVAGLGYDTIAFDLSESAIAGARARHPNSPVHYRVADLLALPPDWHRAFALVVESHNVQALPPDLHATAAAAVASLLAPDGRLLVLAAHGAGAADGPPWPLTQDELAFFAVDGVLQRSVATVRGTDGGSRWRAEYVRPSS